MSIVALKRNSRRFQVPISANGFSLNGGHRNQRMIGDTNLSALINGRLDRCDANDPAVPKLSTKNTKGYLYSRVLFPTCETGACVQTNIVKKEDSTQSNHIEKKVKANSAAQQTTKTNSGANNFCVPECKARSYFIGGRKIYITFNAKNSGEYGQGAISEGEYLSAGLLKRKCLVPCAKQPQQQNTKPKSVSNGGCYHC